MTFDVVYSFYLILLLPAVTSDFVADSASQSIDLKAFVQEAVLMKDFRHPHVLSLVGLAERVGPLGSAPYVIMPYMDNGDLLTYVRDTHVVGITWIDF